MPEAEIPWPHSLPSVSGVQATDSTPEAKKTHGLEEPTFVERDKVVSM